MAQTNRISTQRQPAPDGQPLTSCPTSSTPLSAPASLRIADLTAGQGLTDRYDQVVQQLCDTTAQLNLELLEDGATRFCHHIRHALNADTVYLCNRTSLSIVTTSTGNNSREECEDTRQLHAALTTMVSDLWNCKAPLCPPDIKVFPGEAAFSYCIIPLATVRDQLLIITNAALDTLLVGDYLADTLTSVYNVFSQNSATTPYSPHCEATVFDHLHRKYQISSKVITAKRLALFQQQIKQQSVEFEGLSLASKSTKPEALRTKLPDSLYSMAQLWNDKFTAALDCYALIESAYGYKTLCDNEKLIKFSDSRTLKIRVHAQSLSNPDYLDALQDLTDKAVIHANRLKFFVIPQTGKSHTDALNKLLTRFGMPLPSTAKPRSPAVNLADEFDLLQVNGVNRKISAKQR